jgi:transcriptional regulator with XRE-family HTH domain
MGRDYEQVRQDLARNMKDFRGKRGLSQEALALSADVDRTYVSQIERAVATRPCWSCASWARS